MNWLSATPIHESGKGEPDLHRDPATTGRWLALQTRDPPLSRRITKPFLELSRYLELVGTGFGAG